MKILALEFSSPMRSVAVRRDGAKCGYAEESGTREAKPFAIIDAALTEAGISRAEIECIAVGLGPGSYAGIRIAIAIAQGWQLARGVKVLGISSADLVAAQAGQSRVKNPVFVGVEAQRGELYAARYDVSVFDHPKLIEPFRVVGEEQVKGIFRMDWLPGFESPNGVACVPKADFLALLAARRSNFVPGSALEPIYLRQLEFVKAPPPRIFTM